MTFELLYKIRALTITSFLPIKKLYKLVYLFCSKLSLILLKTVT